MSLVYSNEAITMMHGHGTPEVETDMSGARKEEGNCPGPFALGGGNTRRLARVHVFTFLLQLMSQLVNTCAHFIF